MMDKVPKKDIYKLYIKETPKGFDYKTYIKILNLYSKYFMEDLLLGKTITNILGKFSLVKKRNKAPVFDYAEWNKNKIKIFHFNDHTDNYRIYMLWNKSKHLAAVPYRISLIRKFSRIIAASLKENPSSHERYELR